MIQSLLEQARSALTNEIETLRAVPATLRLAGGRRMVEGASAQRSPVYRFEGGVSSLRFAEVLKARVMEASEAIPVELVRMEGTEVFLRFESDQGEGISEIELEWENDFVPRKTLEEIEFLEGQKLLQARVKRLFQPKGEQVPLRSESLHDGLRNEAQASAIHQSLSRDCTFVWGPPGTGKTATLGFIAANFLNVGKRVLFASNTHRAVDVGFKSILDAMRQIGLNLEPWRISRFGDPVLDDEELWAHHFQSQVEQHRDVRREKVADEIALLQRAEQLEESLADLSPGKRSPSLELERELLEAKLASLGGREEVEERIESALGVNERNEFRRRDLIASTLAKVCTSDLFRQQDFDVVVIDEASMANLPALIVLASHAGSQIVVAGDPMQLPPISASDLEQAREFMEKDIFTFASSATTPAELFIWHDQNPEFTSFFDLQYRMPDSLARTISEVFYEGRLKSGDASNRPRSASSGSGSASPRSGAAYHVLDTSADRPLLVQEDRSRGFRPVNRVHMQRVWRLVQDLLTRGYRGTEIGVIVPFRHVVYEMGRFLSAQGFREIEVGTIHTYQGREKPVIIFDTVVSGEEQDGQVRHYTVRPLDETKNSNPIHVPRLLNVAFSRSQRELYILANMDHIRKMYGRKFLGKLLERLASGR